jgi:hypothetical protein
VGVVVFGWNPLLKGSRKQQVIEVNDHSFLISPQEVNQRLMDVDWKASMNMEEEQQNRKKKSLLLSHTSQFLFGLLFEYILL